MNEADYRVPDILDIIYGDIVQGVYFNSLTPKTHNRIKLTKCNIACELLINSEQPEDVLIENVGFPSLLEFREVFKSYLGIYPDEFRRRFSRKKIEG